VDPKLGGMGSNIYTSARYPPARIVDLKSLWNSENRKVAHTTFINFSSLCVKLTKLVSLDSPSHTDSNNTKEVKIWCALSVDALKIKKCGSAQMTNPTNSCKNKESHT
jgi:hypothetical protein